MYLRESGRQRVVQEELAGDLPYCSEVGFVEVHATLTRARLFENPPRLRLAGYLRAIHDFDADWANIFHLSVTGDLIEDAAQVARQYGLRAYDSLHLASALTLRRNTSETVFLSTWDSDLARAALAAGLSLAHEVTS
jgi:predicted nucleic acid-binding protein